MQSIYATKHLQITQRYQELTQNMKSYFELSLEKEHKQKSFLSRINWHNLTTGEIFKLDYQFDREYKKYIKLLEQKVSAIEQSAKEQGYVSVFMTFTLPSKFHPFKSVKKGKGRLYVSLNNNFEFDSIQEAITCGYRFLNELLRKFYKRVKNYVCEEFLYVKVFEPHATTIPHVHYLVFFPLKHFEAVKGVYQRIVDFYGLNQSDFEVPKFRDNITYASRYLLKYITKNLQNGHDYFHIRSIDGWKRTHKIRVITSSFLGLSHFLYQKIYYALTSEVKSHIEALIKEQKIPYYLYFQKNCYINKTVNQIENTSTKTVKSTFGQPKALFTIELKTNRIRAPNHTLAYRITDIHIKYQQKLLYKKANLIKIKTS